MLSGKGYAATYPKSKLTELGIERRAPRPDDVVVDLLYCGICHSDLHMIDDDFGFSHYPMVPGHEMVGRVVQIGTAVTRFAPGDIAAIGCFVDSCGTCDACREDLEQYCERFPTSSFNSTDRQSGETIFGGFASNYVVREDFALKVPQGLDPARAAPLLCGGITTYSALRHSGAGPGQRVGVVGIGGLGHLAIKFARAMGAYVVTLTTSADKIKDALAFGANEAILLSDTAKVDALAGSLDMIMDTVSAVHDIDRLIGLVRRDGTLCLLGMPAEPICFHSMNLGSRRRRIVGSGVGGIAETQEMLDFCGEHGIVADVEVMPVTAINQALDRLRCNDVRYRFVLDMAAFGD